ncbi:MAG: dienelactone hydrolase family protein [Cyanobacteria bacterium P01_G01_bin.38]
MCKLGIFAEDERGIPIGEVRRFETALADLGKDANIYIYEGVGHAFATPSDQNYGAQSAEDAWDKTLRFFLEALIDG